jgi:hypothetical protein
LLASVLEGQLKLTLGVLLHATRDTDPPRLSNPLQPRSHVHAVTEDVPAFDDHVALVDTDPKFDALLLSQLGIALSHPTLNLDSTAEGVHHTRELHEDAVVGGLHDPAAVLGDLGVYESPAVRLELGQRAFFVDAH